MAMTNAERQQRWRQKLKARAAGADVLRQTQDVVADAIAALWSYHERPAPGGTRWSDIDGCRTPEEFVADLASQETLLVASARAFAPKFDGLTSDEAKALSRLIELADVLELNSFGYESLNKPFKSSGPKDPRKKAIHKPGDLPNPVLPANNTPGDLEGGIAKFDTGPTSDRNRLGAHSPLETSVASGSDQSTSLRARRHTLANKWR